VKKSPPEGVWPPVKRGLKTTAAIFLLVGWVVLALGSVAVLFFPTSESPPRWTGWLLLGASMGIAAVTMNRWIKAAPCIFGYAAINAVIATLSGHTGGPPRIAIPRTEALAMALALTASAGLMATMAVRQLTYTDRAALMGVVATFVNCIANKNWGVPGCIAMFGCLLIAWGQDRLSRR
jgi:hypothetical protein